MRLLLCDKTAAQSGFFASIMRVAGIGNSARAFQADARWQSLKSKVYLSDSGQLVNTAISRGEICCDLSCSAQRFGGGAVLYGAVLHAETTVLKSGCRKSAAAEKTPQFRQVRQKKRSARRSRQTPKQRQQYREPHHSCFIGIVSE